MNKFRSKGWQAELLEMEPELESLRVAESDSGESLQKSEEAMQQWQSQWDEFNHQAAEPRQQAEVQQSRIQHLEQVQTRLLDRVRKLEEEKKSLSPGSEAEEVGELTEQLAELDLETTEKRERVARLSEELEALRVGNDQFSADLDGARNSLQSMRGRQSSLEALQQAALEDQGAAVSTWLEQNQLVGKERLATQVEVAPGWELALETVLGKSLQALCIDSLDSVAHTISGLEQGELALLESGSVASVVNRLTEGTLLEKVLNNSSNTHLQALLGGIYTVETLSQALALRKELSPSESVVTREGLWLGNNWLRVIKANDASRGVIARTRELEQLQQDMLRVDNDVKALSEKLESGREQLQSKEREREVVRREADEHSRRYGELRSQLSARQVRIEQINVRRERIDGEVREAKEQMELEAENLAQARMILQEAIESMESDTIKREELLSRRDVLRADLDKARQQARHDKDKGHELAMRYQSVKTQLDSIGLSIDRTREQVQRLQERREQLTLNLKDNRDPIEEHRIELEQKLEVRLSVEEELGKARCTLEQVETDLKEAEQQRHQAEQSVQGVRNRLEQERLFMREIEVQRDSISQQLKEDNFHLPTLIEKLTDDADEELMEEELEVLAKRITNLGPINLAAIDEYKLESERKQYLDAQNDDLREALETLENAIRRIDKETRTRFKETFDQVNAGLQELFPKVFGGGHSYLELTGEDLLDTGIAIMARPPGKRNTTIHLLSGGEKALTAIALVFSIFRLNPAPFCMLDEVDAPLDDANVGRYARMVEEMSEQVQFIYITHNKISMEIAQQLMGVTMHEAGVSRLVTVDVQEAAELAAV